MDFSNLFGMVSYRYLPSKVTRKLHKYNKNLIPKIPFEYKKRLKVWLPIYGCDKKNSLRFFNGIQLQNIKSYVKTVNGIKKPVIDKNFILKNKKKLLCP